MNAIIEMKDIIKVFPPNVVALDDVSVRFEEGKIHAIVGENGAGKSTLMKVLYGMHAANSGSIYYKGDRVDFHNPGEAIASGIGMVHQEILLIPEYTIWQNVILGVEPVGLLGQIDAQKARQQVQKRIDEYHFNLDPDDYVSDISIAARQKVEILKLLYRNVSILILDEPTSVLTPQEIPKLFDELRRLRQNGHTILFISHHLDEVLELSDRTTVLKRGRNVGTVATDQTSKKELARMMVGREVVFKTRREDHEVGEKVFELEELSYTDPEGRLRLKDIDIQVHAGEIVGIAGVEGNGQFELVNMIMGLIPQREGSLIVDGEDLRQASILNRRKKISFVSQDRGNMGATLSASIKENVIMTHHRLDGRFTTLAGHVMDYQEASAFTDQVREQFSIVMDDDEDPFRSLSGGNQQKVILGRELLLDTPFILLDQPTRGLDVGSIEYVHRQILDMRREGRALLLLSADLDELFRMSDRILVLNRGEIVADLETDETTIEEVGYLMLKGLRDETETD